MQFLAASTVDDLLRGLWGALCQFFYWLMAWLYDLFMNISRVEILSSDNIKPIYQRITMILTIVMVFYVTFEAVKYVIQPETFTDKEKGASKLVIKMVAVVIMIAFVPQIFSWAYKFQNAIFDNQIFSKVILGKQNINTEEFGRTFSANVLGMFYYVDQDNWSKKELEEEANCEKVPCKNIVNVNLNSLVEYGEIPLFSTGLTSKGSKKDEGAGNKVDRYYIHFDGLFAVGVGAFIVYMLILYCVDAGVRVAQLTFLQIISPIAIIGYLSPKKDGIFQKWLKQCLTTYLDLFLRVGIIYFVLLICQILSDAYVSGTLVNNIPGNTSQTMKVFIYIALILGLLMFAKKAPEMLKELFPKTGAASGNFGLKLGDRPALARGAGMAIGAGVVGAKGLISGTVNKAKRDWHNLKSGEHKRDLTNYGQSIGNTWSKRFNNWQTRLDYLRNRGTMDSTQRKAARENIKNAKQELRDAKIEQKSAKAAVHNSKIGLGAPAAGVAGAIGGIVRGAKSGAQATDLKGIGKQVAQGWKDESKALARTEKWYDEGGGSQFDRVMTSVEKGLGITTESERIAEEIKREDDLIKENESLIAAESDVKKKSDEVESRLESKLNTDSKAVVDATAAAYLSAQVPGISINPNEKMAELRKRYKAKTETAQAELKRTVESGGDVAAAEKRLADARKEEELVNKHTMRAAYTQILQNPTASTSDAVAAQKIELMKQSVHTARRNNKTVRTMRKKFEDGNLTQEEFNAFMSGNFRNYDELDKVITTLQTIVNSRTIENEKRKETKRKLETSNANAAAKADNSASGGN